MIISLLLCERMEDNECIFLIGCEQYSTYAGYADSFKFAGDFVDRTQMSVKLTVSSIEMYEHLRSV